MKLFYLFLLLTISATAQTYSYKVKDFANGNAGPMNGVPGDLFMSTITFSNSSNAPIQIFVNCYQKNVAPYWAVCYCYIQCHSPKDDTVTVDIQPFSTTDVTLQFKTDSINPGITTASFRIYQKGFSSITQTVNMTASTMGNVGLMENDKGRILNSYPNPTNDYVVIEGVQNGDNITLCDMTGRLIAYRNATDTECVLDLKNVLPGMYIMEVVNSSAKFTQKIIKQ